MDMQKIGGFLRDLRKQKGLSQEQLAEILGVSARTVSRWETAVNMPDLSILIQIAEFYDVDIKEILDGERKDTAVEKEMKDTLTKVADYSKAERNKLEKYLTAYSITFLVYTFGCLLAILIQALLFKDPKVIAGEAIITLLASIIHTVLLVRNKLWTDSVTIKKKKINGTIFTITTNILTSVFVVLIRYTSTGRIIYSLIGGISCFAFCTLFVLIFHAIMKKITKNKS